MRLELVKLFSLLILSLFISTVASAAEPMPPSGAKLISNIDQMSGWGHCSACAGGATAWYGFYQWQNTPSLDGASLKMSIGGSTPYANALHWKKFGDQSQYKNFIWEFYVYANPSTNYAQNLEFDLFQAANSRKYMFGTQCNYWKKIWQGWNEPYNKWVDLPIPCPKFPVGQWTRVKWYLQRTWDNKVRYISLTVNGTTYWLNHYEPSQWTSWSNTLGVQFQQDMNSSATDYSVWVDNVRLWMW